MAQLNLSSVDIQSFLAGDFQKFLSSMRQAVEKHDFDSGWSPLKQGQSGAGFMHKLDRLPHRVYVYAANDEHGNGYTDVSAKATVTKTQVSLPTNLGYTHYRVLADR